MSDPRVYFALGAVAMLAVVLTATGLWVLLRRAERRQAALIASQITATVTEAEARLTAAITAAVADTDRRIADAVQQTRVETVERFLGMLTDIVKNVRTPDTAVNRFEEAVKAEAHHTAWVRRMELDKAQADVMLKERK